MKKIIQLASAVTLLAGSSAAFATAINANALNLTELQEEVFDDIGSSINANTNETGSEAFQFQSNGATSTYVATVSYSAHNFEWGFYDLGDKTNSISIFDTSWASSNSPGDATSTWIDFSSDYVRSYNFEGGAYNELGNATFADNLFGFYASTFDATVDDNGGIVKTYVDTWYSQSDENAANYDYDGDGIADNDHFLTYFGQGDMVDLYGTGNKVNDFGHMYVATELTNMSGPHPSYSDFTDIVVQLESVHPVPAPATLALLGLGLVGIGATRRRTKA